MPESTAITWILVSLFLIPWFFIIINFLRQALIKSFKLFDIIAKQTPVGHIVDIYFLKSLSPTLIFMIITIISVLLLFYYHYAQDINDNKRIIIAALIAIIGILFQGAFSLHTHMRTKAMEVLRDSRKNENYINAVKAFRQFLKSRSDLKPCAIEEFIYAPDPEEKQAISNLVIIANFYEELAIYIKYKEVYEPILEDFYKPSLLKFCSDIKDWIQPLRSYYGSPLVFCNMEALYKYWASRDDSQI